MEIYVENVERVITGLHGFEEGTRAALMTVLKNIAERIAIRARSAMAGNVRSGNMLGSVRTTVKEYGDKRGGPFVYRRISASIVAGGTKLVRYAHAFERGFDAQVQVSEHNRGTRFNPSSYLSAKARNGRIVAKRVGGFTVKPYKRRHHIAAHLYLDAALRAEAPGAAAAIAAAVDTTARLKGFA